MGEERGRGGEGVDNFSIGEKKGKRIPSNHTTGGKR